MATTPPTPPPTRRSLSPPGAPKKDLVGRVLCDGKLYVKYKRGLNSNTIVKDHIEVFEGESLVDVKSRAVKARGKYSS